MKQTLLKQLIKLERDLLANTYAVTIKIARDKLLISIPLKDKNEKQVLSQWGSVKKAGG